MNISSAVFFTSIISGSLRHLTLCLLWGYLMPRKYSFKRTFFTIAGIALVFDLIYCAIELSILKQILSALWVFIFYGTMFILVFRLHKGTAFEKTIHFFLVEFTFMSSAFPITLLYTILPEKTQYLINYPFTMDSVFSSDFVEYIMIMLLSFILIMAISFFPVFAYKRLRYGAALPQGAKFMLVPASQFFMLASYLFSAYENGMLVSKNGLMMQACLCLSIAICIVSDVFLFFVLRDMGKKSQLETQLKLMEQSQLADYEQYRAVDNLYRREREFRHDINNKLITAQALLQQEETGELKLLLQEISGVIAGHKHADYCENALINTILNNKAALAKSLGIQINTVVQLSELSLPKTELCSLFSNILDNAIEAAQVAAECFDPKIELKAVLNRGYLIIECTNTALSPPKELDGKIISGKGQPGRGWGLGILEKLANEYDGELHTSFKDNSFFLRESLKLPQSSPSEN